MIRAEEVAKLLSGLDLSTLPLCKLPLIDIICNFLQPAVNNLAQTLKVDSLDKLVEKLQLPSLDLTKILQSPPLGDLVTSLQSNLEDPSEGF